MTNIELCIAETQSTGDPSCQAWAAAAAAELDHLRATNANLLAMLEFIARRFDTARKAEASHVQFSVHGVVERTIRAAIETATKGQ